MGLLLLRSRIRAGERNGNIRLPPLSRAQNRFGARGGNKSGGWATEKDDGKTGERKAQILQTSAPSRESEGRAHHHRTSRGASRRFRGGAAIATFASKAQMFEGLIEFHRADGVHAGEQDPAEEKRDAMKQVEATIATLLGFAQKNRA